MGATDRDAVLAAPKTNEVDAALRAGELIERHRNTAKTASVLHGAPYVILRDKEGNERLEYVREQFVNPTFRKGEVKLVDAPSFITYFNAHKGESSSIFASLNPCNFVGVLDEHPESPEEPAAWREFRAVFTPMLSTEWTAWTKKNGASSGFDSTEEFAYFVEDNAPDFVNPESAAMLEMALNFKVNQKVDYKAVQRLQDGNVEFQYANIVDAQVANRQATGGGTMKIPEVFEIEIPIFQGLSVPPRRMQARFRFRLSQGHLKLWYELVRPLKVLEQAVKELALEVQDGTDVQVLLGTTD